MRFLIAIAILLISPTIAFSAPKEVYEECFMQHETWNKRAACVNDWIAEDNRLKTEELREFLKQNPRYKYPGQSLNKCFGKKRKVLISEVEHKANGDIIIRYPEYVYPCE